MPIYLKFDGIDGEFQEQADVLSFSWGVSNSGNVKGGGGGAGRVQLQDLTIMKQTDALSPTLYRHCATGKHIKKVELSVLRGNGDGKLDTFYKITMSDVLVSSYQSGGAEGSSEIPTEELSLNYHKIEFFTKGQPRTD